MKRLLGLPEAVIAVLEKGQDSRWLKKRKTSLPGQD